MYSLELARSHFLAALEAMEAEAYPDAVELLRKAAALAPERTSIQVNLAAALLRNHQPHEAEACARALLAKEDDLPEAQLNLGSALLAQGRFAESALAFRQLLATHPERDDARANLCGALEKQGLHDEILLQTCSKNPDLMLARARALQAVGRTDEARELAMEAARIAAASPEATCALAMLLVEQGARSEAMQRLEDLNTCQPGHADAWLARATLEQKSFNFEPALQLCEQGLRYSPGHAMLLTLKGLLLARMHKPKEAGVCFETALQRVPNQPGLLGLAHQMALQCADWGLYQERSLQLRTHVDRGLRATEAFCFLNVPSTPAQQRRCAEIEAHEALADLPSAAWHAQVHTHSRLRIGYFSADFHDHATAWLMARIFELHDRQRFEIHAFSFGPPREQGMRIRLRQGIEHFHECHDLSDAQIISLAQQLEIDIAIDLKGYTTDSRAKIFAHRVAPLQVNYLGYPGTLAHPGYDYLLGDAIVTPQGSDAFYSEKLIRLPHSYQANDSHREICSQTPSRNQLGLPAEGRVLCCFNNTYKLCPQAFSIWTRLLKAFPDCVLWLLHDNDTACMNLRREAERSGIAANRLIFAPRTAMPEHLARQRQADLFLDTFHYNAHTTASDALWAELPVLTCAGQTFASRVGASLLTAVGLPELITNTPEEYEARAHTLLSDSTALPALRQRLHKLNPHAPLFDSARFTRNFEAALLHMQSRQIAGLPPVSFDQPDTTPNGTSMR